YAPQVDCFVLLDDFSTSRQSWQQRNRLFVAPNRIDWVTAPIRISGNFGKPLNEMPLVEDERWRRKLKTLFKTSYGRAPCFSEVAEYFDGWLSRRQTNLAQLNIEFIEEISVKLGLNGRLIRSSSLSLGEFNRSQRILAILRALGATDYLAAVGSFGY